MTKAVILRENSNLYRYLTVSYTHLTL
ncbi:MAG: hypothetical protein CI947_1342, partial [Halanaerobium sp.]